MTEKKARKIVKNSSFSNLDWYYYFGKEEEMTDPCNKTPCMVLLDNGQFKPDMQNFGCWRYSNIVAWASIND